MSDISILLSNGTCYHSAFARSSGNVIPCGNVAIGPSVVLQCCQAGDYCLEDSFCWNKPYNTTYLAGCTDALYASPNCPPMGTSHQQLLGLVVCNSSQGSSPDRPPAQVLWSDCPGPTTQTALALASSLCTCTGTMSGLLWASSSLAMVASLPTRLGGIISVADGQTPVTGGMSMTTVTASRGGRQTTMAVPTDVPFPMSGGLSTAAQAGIGIGAATMGLAFVGLGFAWFVWRRRGRRKDEHGDDSIADTLPAQQYSHRESISIDEPGASWGYKSELPAESRHVNRVELPADDVWEPLPPVKDQSLREESEDGPVSAASVLKEGMVDRNMPATVLEIKNLPRCASQRPLEGAQVGNEESPMDDYVRVSVERRYGEVMRLEAISELNTE